MKKSLLMVLFIVITFLSFGAEKKVYLIIPGAITIDGGISTTNGKIGKVNKDDIYLIYGMASKGSITSISADSIDNYRDGSNKIVAQLVEITIKTDRSDAKLKVAMSYEASTNKYIILADENVNPGTIDEMKEVYTTSISFSPEILLTTTSNGGEYNYNDFPGYEIKENVRVFNGLVGKKKMSEVDFGAGDSPSNIIEKLEKNEDSGSIEGKIRINPGNNHFKLIDLNEDKHIASDFKSFLKEAGSDYVYFDGSAKELEFKVIGGDHTVEIDGIETTFKSGKKYTYNDLERVILLNDKGKDKENGNGHWYVSLSGKSISFQPDEVEDEEFYIKADGHYYMFDDNDDDYSDYDDDDENLRLRKVTLKEKPDWNNGYEAEVEEWGEILDYINEYPDQPTNEDTWYTFFDGSIEELRFEYDHNNEFLPKEGLNKIDDDDYRYVFDSPKRMVLKGKMDDDNEFDDDGELWHISFPEGDTQEEIFIIAGVGDVLEANVNMTSGDDQSRNRSSEVEIDVLNGEFEIKSIKE